MRYEMHKFDPKVFTASLSHKQLNVQKMKLVYTCYWIQNFPLQQILYYLYYILFILLQFFTFTL